MGRLRTKGYKPESESSSREAAAAKKEGRLRIAIPRDGEANRLACLCGCGQTPAGKKSEFAMGHDARLRGMLQRAHLTETEVVEIVDGTETSPVSAAEVAGRHDWGRYLEQAEAAREGKNRQVLNKALGSKRLVKIGRWEYTGQVVAIYENGDEHYEVEYVTKTGDVRRTRVKASEAKEMGA